MTDEEPTSRSRMLTHGSPGMCGSGNAQTDQGVRINLLGDGLA